MDYKMEANKTELGLIHKIIKRLDEAYGVEEFSTHVMDLDVCHSNGNPLNLLALYESNIEDLAHDVYGINRHINRDTGELMDGFSPRYSEAYHPII